MCESSHKECCASRNGFKLKLAVGENNIGENPGLSIQANVHIGLTHSKQFLESTMKPASGGRADQLKLVIKVPVGSAAEGLKAQAESAIEMLGQLGLPIFEILGKPTIEVDAEGLYVSLNAPEAIKQTLAGQLKAVSSMSENIKNIEGEVKICIKAAADASSLFNELKAKRPPMKELLKGFCFCVCSNGNRPALRQILQDFASHLDENLKRLLVPAYLFHCAKLELNFESSDELPAEIVQNFPLPIPDIPSASDLGPLVEIIKFKQSVGEAMTGGLQFFAATKMFAVQITVNARNLSTVLKQLSS